MTFGGQYGSRTASGNMNEHEYKTLECPSRKGKSHSRGRNFNQGRASSLVEIPTPRMRLPYPAWTGPWWILFLPPLRRLFLRPAAEDMVMWDRRFSRGQISYRQRIEKICLSAGLQRTWTFGTIQLYTSRNVRKRTFGHVRPAKIQISLRIRT